MDKKCTKCGVLKFLAEFGKHKNGLLGRNSECKTCQAEREKIYKTKNSQTVKEYNKKYKTQNQEYISEYNKIYLKKRYNNDPIYRFICNTRTHINVRLKNFLKNKKGSTLEYLGCDWNTFLGHIESQFTNEMNWNNYGKNRYWEIDHIKPLSKGGSFHYTNCRPFPIDENRAKYNKF
jgi:hypothetical protein